MPDTMEQHEQHTTQTPQSGYKSNGHEQEIEKRYKVRQVTNMQVSWTEQERGEEGAFTLQLILDNGVEEYILRPEAEDMDVLLKLFAKGKSAMFDIERKILMFGSMSVK